MEMDNLEKLLKATVQEIEKMLSSKTVVGEPIVVENNTIIPLINIGFGFAAGGGAGKESGSGKAEGQGGGTGGGGGAKPVAILIINKDGVRLEPIKSGASSMVEKVVETIGKVASKN
ncbi:MAG: spore germination protein GerW family protein, partial [Nitrospinota bacterium]|nr:spore germination protein GerW family protein [Nitrospinota bacterium]